MQMLTMMTDPICLARARRSGLKGSNPGPENSLAPDGSVICGKALVRPACIQVARLFAGHHDGVERFSDNDIDRP